LFWWDNFLKSLFCSVFIEFSWKLCWMLIGLLVMDPVKRFMDFFVNCFLFRRFNEYIYLRVQYKILVTVFKCLDNQAPDYLKCMLQTPTRIQSTRSSQDLSLLLVPSTRTKTFADRNFSVTGPRLWNELPTNLRQLSSLNDFKKQLKTFLFNKF